VLENSSNSLPSTKTIQRKALKGTTYLKILWQGFKTSDGWTIKYMHFKGLAHYWRIKLTLSFPTGFLEKLLS
jgi:hypothetical protein